MSTERKNKWTFIVHAHTPLGSGTHYLDGLTQAVMQAADAEQAELRAENERLREDRVQHIGDDSIRGMELKDATKRAESAEAEVARLTRLLEQRTAALARTIDAKNAAEAKVTRVEKTLHAWKTGPWASNPVFRDFWGALNTALKGDA